MFTIVLPITQFSYFLNNPAKPTKDHDNIQRFFKIGWQTFTRFMQWKDVHTFFVILPSKHRVEFEHQCDMHVHASIRSKMVCLLDEDLVKYPIEKYRTQMLIKLLIAKYVKTAHYLLIDDDIVLLRSFGIKDLFANRMTRQVRYTREKSFHGDWWRASALALKIPFDVELRKQTKLISVTPEIMITKEVKNLIRYLDGLYDDWQHTLVHINPRWYDYPLYWLYLIKTKKTNHYRGTTIPLSDNATNIWYASDNLDARVEKMWKNKKQYFGVIQSNVPEHTVIAVEAAVRKVGIFG